jgi:glycerophosphoryl diester phosphodiesterase
MYSPSNACLGMDMRELSLSLLICVAACGSSSSTPIDPLATSYCAACSELASCERVINETLMAACPDETSTYYSCLTENTCDESACTAEWDSRNICMGQAPKDSVTARIAALSPSANLGHRGTGVTGEGNPFPENSIPSFEAAMDEGANGVELDAEITMDGQVIVMHDDTVDRTTDCTGCVSAMTFEEIRACRLLDRDGNPTTLHPPTLQEVYDALGEDALINIELKVFEEDCATPTTGASALVAAVLAEVVRIGGQKQTLFSSFDETAVEAVKTLQPGLYAGLLSSNPDTAFVQRAIALGLDAIHPLFSISADDVQVALDAGLQVNVWGVNNADFMQQQLDKGSTAIITDEPAVLAELLGETQ